MVRILAIANISFLSKRQAKQTLPTYPTRYTLLMSIYGAEVQEPPYSMRQINNFLKLCVVLADFTQPGLLREDGPSEIIDFWHINIFPILDSLDFQEEDLKIDDLLSDTPIVASGSSYAEKTKVFQLEALREQLCLLRCNKRFDSKKPHWDLTMLQLFKEVVKANVHFMRDIRGLLLRDEFLDVLPNYFWKNLVYENIRYNDSSSGQLEKRDSDYDTRTAKLFVGAIAFLLKTGREDLAELLHNVLHVSYLCSQGDDVTTPFHVGKLVSPCLLSSPFNLRDKIVPGRAKEEVTLNSELIGICLKLGIFSKRFSAVKDSFYLAQDTSVLEARLHKAQEDGLSSVEAHSKKKTGLKLFSSKHKSPVFGEGTKVRPRKTWKKGTGSSGESSSTAVDGDEIADDLSERLNVLAKHKRAETVVINPLFGGGRRGRPKKTSKKRVGSSGVSSSVGVVDGDEIADDLSKRLSVLAVSSSGPRVPVLSFSGLHDNTPPSVLLAHRERCDSVINKQQAKDKIKRSSKSSSKSSSGSDSGDKKKASHKKTGKNS